MHGAFELDDAIAYSERLASAIHKPKGVVGTPESAAKIGGAPFKTTS